MKDQLLNLAEKAANYKRGGNHLLKALRQVEHILENLLGDYSQFRFISTKSVAYLGNLATSNIGVYGSALCFVESRQQDRYKPLPASWTEAGSGFYLHNDFHVWIDTATRSEIAKIAANLPDFLQSLAEFLEEKGTQNEISASEIEKIAGALRAAVK